MKSDEEYDDLAMQDMQENGYRTDDDEEMREKQVPRPGTHSDDGYSRDLERFPRTRDPDQLSEPLCSHTSLLMENDRRMLPPLVRVRKRSLSIPAFKNQGSIIGDPILSGAPQS